MKYIVEFIVCGLVKEKIYYIDKYLRVLDDPKDAILTPDEMVSVIHYLKGYIGNDSSDRNTYKINITASVH